MSEPERHAERSDTMDEILTDAAATWQAEARAERHCACGGPFSLVRQSLEYDPEQDCMVDAMASTCARCGKERVNRYPLRSPGMLRMAECLRPREK